MSSEWWLVSAIRYHGKCPPSLFTELRCCSNDAPLVERHPPLTTYSLVDIKELHAGGGQAVANHRQEFLEQ